MARVVALMTLLELTAAAAGVATVAPTCATKLGGPGTCLRSMGYQYDTEITDPAACCAACSLAAPECVAFEVRARGGDPGPVCILKNSSEANTPFPSKDCTGFGFLGPAPAPGPPGPAPPTPGPPPPTHGLAINDMFHGGAVLQRGEMTSVWGRSDAKTVTVSLSGGGGSSVSGPVNASGVWLVHFPPQPAAWNRTLTVKDASGASLSVIVSFGEAILCVGQVRSRQLSTSRGVPALNAANRLPLVKL